MSILRTFVQFMRPHKSIRVKDAYRLWAEPYDNQPDNLVLAMEDEVFTTLLHRISISGKRVVDIGCGTGRHWNALLNAHPAQLIGVDVSAEMLSQLKRKFPDALVFNDLSKIEDHSADVIVSTLTIGHIADIENAFREWHRILKPGGEIVVTDFHPEGFRKGMTRTFKHKTSTIEVENYYHSVEDLKSCCRQLHCPIEIIEERTITEESKPAFERAGNMNDYQRFIGTPLILGFVARKTE